jgi:hypothetical protein
VLGPSDQKIPQTWDGDLAALILVSKKGNQRKENPMATLHIQHPVTDFDTWTSAFSRFADARLAAGVRAQRIHRPVDDPKFVVIDLDFDSPADAQSFRQFLTTNVWAHPENSPGLAGTPETMILESVELR